MENLLKQYHDAENAFHKETQITFSQCGENHLLSLQELLRLTSDTAVEDYNQRGYSWQFLYEHDCAILLSRSSFHITKMPCAHDFITIHTWEEKPQSIQLSRAYRVTETATGCELVSGHSTWLVVNPKTRRIIPSKNFTLREPPVKETVYNGIPCGKITLPQEGQEWEQRIVRSSDLDGNGHTNNARYGSFALDAMPEQYRLLPFTDIRINYSKEAVKNDVITICGSCDDTERAITVAGTLPSGEACFECAFSW